MVPPSKDTKAGLKPSWPLLEPATQHGSASLETLLTRYLPVIQVFLSLRDDANARSAVEHIDTVLRCLFLDHSATMRAISHCGGFRPLLLRAVTICLEACRDQASDHVIPEKLALALSEVTYALGDDYTFNSLWARQLLRLSIERARLECLAAGQEKYWQLFEMRVLVPAVEGTVPPSFGECLQALGFAGLIEMCQALATTKQRLHRGMRRGISDYMRERGIESEVNLLRTQLSGAQIGFRGSKIISPTLLTHEIANHSAEWLLASARLDKLFSFATITKDYDWPAEDLAELLLIQLDRPLGPLPPADACSIRAALLNPHVTRETLVGIKDLAKSLQGHAFGLPKEILQLLYVLAIAAGFVYLNKSITRLSSPVYGSLLAWALALQWIDPDARVLLRACREHLLMEH